MFKLINDNQSCRCYQFHLEAFYYCEQAFEFIPTIKYHDKYLYKTDVGVLE